MGYDALANTQLGIHEWLWAYDIEADSFSQSQVGSELFFLLGISHGDLWGSPQLVTSGTAGGSGESLRRLLRAPPDEPQQGTGARVPRD